MKTYIAVVHDHSGSMASLSKGAINDFNSLKTSISESMESLKSVSEQEVFITSVPFGSTAVVEYLHKPLMSVPVMTSYPINGMTALWDAVGLATESLDNLPQEIKDDPNTAFMVMVITDGQENVSRKYSINKLMDLIRTKQMTDRWSFIFRVPRGYAKDIIRAGIPAGNVMEWEQTEKALSRSTEQTLEATKNYFQSRAKGETKTTTFYANIGDMTVQELEVNLEDISSKTLFAVVDENHHASQIRDFCNDTFKEYNKGSAYYELVKPETVQSYKQIAVREKQTGKVYKGIAARHMLGLPLSGNVRLAPGRHGDFELYIQSTSVNRKLNKNTNLLYIK
jgi:hypothetical protein